MALLMVNKLFKNASYMTNKSSFLFSNNAVLNGGNLLKQSHGTFAQQWQQWDTAKC